MSIHEKITAALSELRHVAKEFGGPGGLKTIPAILTEVAEFLETVMGQFAAAIIKAQAERDAAYATILAQEQVIASLQANAPDTADQSAATAEQAFAVPANVTAAIAANQPAPQVQAVVQGATAAK